MRPLPGIKNTGGKGKDEMDAGICQMPYLFHVERPDRHFSYSHYNVIFYFGVYDIQGKRYF